MYRLRRSWWDRNPVPAAFRFHRHRFLLARAQDDEGDERTRRKSRRNLAQILNVRVDGPTFSSTSPMMRVPAAGPCASTEVTNAPVAVSCAGRPPVPASRPAPICRCIREPPAVGFYSRATAETVSAGMANPSPTEPPLGEKIAEVTPRPSRPG